jgi:hypothetical protein
MLEFGKSYNKLDIRTKQKEPMGDFISCKTNGSDIIYTFRNKENYKVYDYIVDVVFDKFELSPKEKMEEQYYKFYW